MKLNTTKALIATAIATVFVGLSATAIAQNAAAPTDLHAQHTAQRGAPMDPARLAEMQKQMAERHAQRMERLKTELKLSPAQDTAWKAYVARTEPTSPKAPAAAQDWSRLTTPQRMEAMQALHNERSAEMSKRIDATKAFYAQLTPEQQKVFDTQSGLQRAGMKGEHRRGGHGRHGGEHHGMGGGMGCEGGPLPEGPGPRS